MLPYHLRNVFEHFQSLKLLKICIVFAYFGVYFVQRDGWHDSMTSHENTIIYHEDLPGERIESLYGPLQ